MSGRLSLAQRGSSPGQGPGESLRKRRRLRRRRILFALGILFLLLCGGIIYELQQSAVRISHVEIFGADQSFADIANAAMQGKYLGIIPRDSTFFFPASRIRADIITLHPDIAAVSIFRNGLTGLSIRVDDRVPIARWCGSTDSTNSPQASSLQAVPSPNDCYFFDASGFVYATSSSDSIGSPQAAQPVNSFIVYESPANGNETIGSTLPNAAKLPAAFDFARQLGILGSTVTRVILHDGEIDDYLASGTRVTYVLGNEQNAFTALVSARTNFNLTDGSVDYVDLRFDGKVYLKKK
jgi:hypothetical protein